MTKELPRLSRSEYRLLGYLPNPTNPQRREEMASSIGVHRSHISLMLRKLSGLGVLTTKHRQDNVLDIKVNLRVSA